MTGGPEGGGCPTRGRAPFKPTRPAQSAATLYEVVHQITLYTTDTCSFCSRVKALLSAREVEFAEINLSRDPVGRAELAQRTGMLSFPQVLIDGELLGGFAELQAAADSGRLAELLAA
jgi:glutaredoxin 3